MENFEELLKARKAASDAYVTGDAGPLLAMSPEEGVSSLFPPSGDQVVGAAEVNAFNRSGAAAFDIGSTNEFQVSHSGVSDGLAYWVGLQESVVKFKGKEEPVPMTLRITEVFSKHSGKWQLVHRHADLAKED